VTDDDFRMSPLYPRSDPTSFEIPKHHVSRSVSRTDEPPIGRESRFASVSGDRVSGETFLALNTHTQKKRGGGETKNQLRAGGRIGDESERDTYVLFERVGTEENDLVIETGSCHPFT
jgi:hypothetical protein